MINNNKIIIFTPLIFLIQYNYINYFFWNNITLKMSQFSDNIEYPIKRLIKIRPEKIYKSPTKKKLSIAIPKMKFESNAKQKLYDRFIPYGISPSFNCDPPSYSSITSGKFSEKKYIQNTVKKNNYEKCLLADLIGTSIQGKLISNDPRQNIGYINMLNSINLDNLIIVKFI